MESPRRQLLRVLVADIDGVLGRKTCEDLFNQGFDAQAVMTGRQLRQVLAQWKPDVLITDLLLPEGNAFEMLKFITDHPVLKKNPPKVIVTSSHNKSDNVRQCFRAGASDYLIKPYSSETLIQRISFLFQEKKVVQDAKSEQGHLVGEISPESGDFYMQLLDIVLREANTERDKRTTLFNLTRMLAMTLRAVRCSIIEVNMHTQEGCVVVSSDNPDLKDKVIDLSGYPEVTYVANKEQIIAIENVSQNPILAEVSKKARSISFNAMIVCPLWQRGETFGVVSVRMGKGSIQFKDRDVRFVRLVSQVLSLVLNSIEYIPVHKDQSA